MHLCKLAAVNFTEQDCFNIFAYVKLRPVVFRPKAVNLHFFCQKIVSICPQCAVAVVAVSHAPAGRPLQLNCFGEHSLPLLLSLPLSLALSLSHCASDLRAAFAAINKALNTAQLHGATSQQEGAR